MDINAKSLYGWTSLMSASRIGCTELVEKLLEKKALVNEKNNRGWTSLRIAARNGHALVAKLLLLRRAICETPLMAAINQSHIPVIELLLEAKANINAIIEYPKPSTQIFTCYTTVFRCATSFYQTPAEQEVSEYSFLQE